MAVVRREKSDYGEIAYEEDDATITENPDGTTTVKPKGDTSTVTVTITFGDGRPAQTHTLEGANAEDEVTYNRKEKWVKVREKS